MNLKAKTQMLFKMSVRPDFKRACNPKLTRRKYTPLYEKGTKQTQNKSMETTATTWNVQVI